MTFIMATSSSDESNTAPKDFHVSSSLDSGSRLSPSRRKCPLCCNFRQSFCCKDCVNSGNFICNIDSEKYIDKQLRFMKTKTNCKSLESTCLELIEKKQKIDVVSTKIRLSKERIQILKLAIAERKQKKQLIGNRLLKLRGENGKLCESLPKYEGRVGQLETYNAGRREYIGKKIEELAEKQEELKKIAQIRIRELVQEIFPIRKVEAKPEMETSESDMVTALAEASHTMYIRDRWVTDNSGEMQYSIVAPCLPASGNYSDYNDWVAQNKDTVTGPNANNVCVELNPAYKISAALTYTAQLVHMLAYFLDVRLPYKMLISDFCSSDMNKGQFSRRVARLNANILHLCFSQNTDLSSLRPCETIHNILQLIDTANTDLGRQGPMELDPVMTNSLEQQLGPNLETGEDSDSEEGDMLPVEWEAVPHVQLPEACAGPINLQSTQMISTQASSMAGGLVTSAAASIASIWRGWTGR